MTLEAKNARIEGTTLGIEDHGCLIFYLHLDYGGGGQGFGGFVLDTHVERGQPRIGTVFGTTAILRVLQVLGVGTWEKLPGTPVRVEADGSKIYRIGHYLKDEWLDLEELAKELE